MQTNLEKINSFLENAEIPLFSNANVDNEYLQLPEDLTILPTSEIMKYMNAFVQQKMYIRTLVSQARAVYREARSNYDKDKCKVFSSAPAKMSVTEKELRVYSDERAEASRNFMEYALEKLDFLKDILDSYEDGIFLVSREITRRGKDVEDMNRAAKFNA